MIIYKFSANAKPQPSDFVAPWKTKNLVLKAKRQARKSLSILSQRMPETERCAARELLTASVVFWEVTEEARQVGHILGKMKSADDQNTVLRYFGASTHRAVAIGETDIQLVNESLTSITTPQATAEAKIIRDEMIEVRDLLKPFASEKWWLAKRALIRVNAVYAGRLRSDCIPAYCFFHR
jgi:hypothetical protein